MCLSSYKQCYYSYCDTDSVTCRQWVIVHQVTNCVILSCNIANKDTKISQSVASVQLKVLLLHGVFVSIHAPIATNWIVSNTSSIEHLNVVLYYYWCANHTFSAIAHAMLMVLVHSHLYCACILFTSYGWHENDLMCSSKHGICMLRCEHL